MKPLVTVVVPHHLNKNDEYLKWCLKSILASTYVDLEVFCISDADLIPSIPGDSRLELIWDKELTNVTKKWHYGIKQASSSSQYVMLISDDVMVSKFTIGELARTIDDSNMILSPASNCDATTRYHASFHIGYGEGNTIRVPLKCSLDDIKNYENAVIDHSPGQRILIDPGWVSFYCTLFPKKVLEAVGDFDEHLDVRYNDVDYCHRARALGIPSLIHLGVFALHFGDKTLPLCTTQEEYAKADAAYRQKYHSQLSC